MIARFDNMRDDGDRPIFTQTGHNRPRSGSRHACRLGAGPIGIPARYRQKFTWVAIWLCAASVLSSSAEAQRAQNNAVVNAQDAFGLSVGEDKIGLYGSTNVRGFSPTRSGNIRVEGLYFDKQASFTVDAFSGSRVGVGLSALNYIFPAPSGIVDYQLKPSDQDRLSSSLVVGPRETRFLAFEFSSAEAGHGLSYAAGITFAHDRSRLDGRIKYAGLGSVLRYASSDSRRRMTLFANYIPQSYIRTDPILYSDGASLPREFGGQARLGQKWAFTNAYALHFGGLVDWQLSDRMQLKAGLFQSAAGAERQFDQVALNAAPDGQGDLIVFASPGRKAVSNSGEIRLDRNDELGAIRARTTLAMRARSLNRRFGGADEIRLGRIDLADDPQFAEPGFDFERQSHDAVRQFGFGVQERLDWNDRLEALIGVERAIYEARRADGIGGRSKSQSGIWLHNVALAWRFNSHALLFGAASRGLEDSGVAPANATNRGELLPAIESSQREIGIRLSANKSASLSVGVFELKKPLPDFAPDGSYRLIGELANRGLEASLSAHPGKGLTILTGIYLARPRIKDGGRPPGSFGRQAQLYVDYAPQSLKGLSFDLRINHQGATSVGPQLQVPKRTTVDVGARWLTRLDKLPVAVRLLAQNLTSEGGWLVDNSGGLSPPPARALVLTVSVDRGPAAS